MTLGWDAPTDDGGSPLTLDYEIYWNAGTNNGYVQKVASTSSARTYQITGLTTGTTYSFKIKAKNEVGSSTLSENSNFQAAAVPSMPTNLALVS
jgi:large repetitive protein